MPRPQHPLRRYILSLVRAGQLSDVAEAALIADVSPRAVQYWLDAAEINIHRERMIRITKMRGRAQREMERRRR